MNEQPLFKKVDEQEAAFAPEQLAPNDPAASAARIEDDPHDAETGSDVVGVPAAGAGLLGLTGAGTSSSIAGGAPGAIGAVVGASADEDETASDHPV